MILNPDWMFIESIWVAFLKKLQIYGSRSLRFSKSKYLCHWSNSLYYVDLKKNNAYKGALNCLNDMARGRVIILLKPAGFQGSHGSPHPDSVLRYQLLNQINSREVQWALY